MESSIEISESTPISCQEDMKIVLDGTKNMMEQLELKKEEIAELEQNVTKNENTYTNMRNLVNSLKESINKNVADIESRTNFTIVIEEYKTKFIPTAQTIYTILLDFNKVITLVEATLNDFVDTVNENEQIYNTVIEEYNQNEKQLTTEVEETIKVNFQYTESKEALVKENIAVKLETENLNHEVESYDQKLTNTFGFEENDNNPKHEIIMLNDECKSNDDEILVVSKLFDSITLQSQEDYAKISTNIVNYELKISELEQASQHAVDKLEHLVHKEKNSDTELLMSKESLKKSETDLISLSNKSEEVIKRTMEAEERFDKEMVSYAETLTKIEELIKFYNEINSRLTEKIVARKNDVELLNSDVDTLKVIIADLVEQLNEDVYKQLEAKQDNLQELNLEVTTVNDTYKLSLIEKQEILQAAITDTENGNTKTDEYCRILVTELIELQDKTRELQKEKNSNDILKDLKKQCANKRRTVTIKQDIRPQKLRRWDSDSTIDDEN